VFLPNPDRALIDPIKLHGYLLSSTHPIGRFKARFFAALGFTAERWQELDAALRSQHLTRDAHFGGTSPHGQLFAIHATLKGSQDAASVVSVWLVRTGEDNPCFKTAYPGGAQ
jgi:hypothetical protein